MATPMTTGTTRTMAAALDWLDRQGACPAARAYAASCRSPAAAWRDCPRPDWLAWALAELEFDARRAVEAGCRCLRLAEPAWPRRGTVAARRALAAVEADLAGAADRAALEAAAAAVNRAYMQTAGGTAAEDAARAACRLVGLAFGVAAGGLPRMAWPAADAVIWAAQDCLVRPYRSSGPAVLEAARVAVARQVAAAVVEVVPYAEVARAAGLAARGAKEKGGAA